MKLAKIVITDNHFLCEECRSNAIEMNVINNVYEIAECPICHNKIIGIRDRSHFWKVGLAIDNVLSGELTERFIANK